MQTGHTTLDQRCLEIHTEHTAYRVAGFVHNVLANVLATAGAGLQKQEPTRAPTDHCRACEDDHGTLYATYAKS